MDNPRDLPPPPPLDTLVAEGPIALFLDFDGTLVPIAPTPDGIAVPPDLAKRLEELSARLGHRLAVVSGRSPANLAEHLGPLAVAVAGSHGAAQRKRDGGAFGPDAERLPDLAIGAIERAAEREGALLERKTHGLALHYRSAPKKEDAVVAAAQALAAEHGLALKRGKCVVEFVLPGADKGRAVEAFLAEPEFAGAMPVFVGDDVTDEDGFCAAAKNGGFGVAVGERPSNTARYHLPSVSDVHAWLNL